MKNRKSLLDIRHVNSLSISEPISKKSNSEVQKPRYGHYWLEDGTCPFCKRRDCFPLYIRAIKDYVPVCLPSSAYMYDSVNVWLETCVTSVKEYHGPTISEALRHYRAFTLDAGGKPYAREKFMTRMTEEGCFLKKGSDNRRRYEKLYIED